MHPLIDHLEGTQRQLAGKMKVSLDPWKQIVGVHIRLPWWARLRLALGLPVSLQLTGEVAGSTLTRPAGETVLVHCLVCLNHGEAWRGEV